MTDTRMVRLEQIAAGKFNEPPIWVSHVMERLARERGKMPAICVRQIGDATGGDVFEPSTATDQAMVSGLVSANWPHLVQVEVVNG